MLAGLCGTSATRSYLLRQETDALSTGLHSKYSSFRDAVSLMGFYTLMLDSLQYDWTYLNRHSWEQRATQVIGRHRFMTIYHVTTVCKWDQYILDVLNHAALSSKVSFRFISCTKAFRTWAVLFSLNKRRCFFNTLDTLRFKECIILYILHRSVIYQLRLFHLWICRIWDCTWAFLGACHAWHISWKDLGVSPGPNEVYIVSFQGRWLSLSLSIYIYLHEYIPIGRWMNNYGKPYSATSKGHQRSP